MRRGNLIPLTSVLVLLAQTPAHAAKQLRITIALPSERTPVQRLNHDGVEAARKHELEKAESLFYKAYLYDPGDPFTLNNLGYAAELRGDSEHAQKFYALAEKQDCNAVIELSTLNTLKGKPMLYALQDLQDASLRLNRLNVQAIELLRDDQGFEAVLLLRRALALDPQNPFTLNNLAVAEEETGDLENAAVHYQQVANLHSSQTIVVTPQRSWRGKSISALAQTSLDRVQDRLSHEGTARAHAAMLALRGVSEVNSNNWQAARPDFMTAYELAPEDAFALNNRGYVAERDGDMETAQFFYDKARKAADSGSPIGLATSAEAHGKAMHEVSATSTAAVTHELDLYSQSRRSASQGQEYTPELTPRGDTVSPSSPQPSTPAPPTQPQ